MEFQTGQHTLMKGDRKGRSDMNSDAQRLYLDYRVSETQGRMPISSVGRPHRKLLGQGIILKHSLKLPTGGRI